MPALLSALFRDAGISAPINGDPEILGLSEDSRRIHPGWIFVAVPGTRVAGNDFVDHALSRGAAAVIAEIPVDVPVPAVVVADSRSALADLAAAFYHHPSKDLTCLGVTGTDGKTTTCLLTASILNVAGHSAGLVTTVETVAGGTLLSQQDRLTTPSAPGIQSALAAMRAQGDTYAVVECSSHALVQQRLKNVALHAAAITNITSDHVEFHGSHQAYETAKSTIGSLMGTSPAARLVVNLDSPSAMRAARLAAKRLLTFGSTPKADLYASDIQTTLDGSKFRAHYLGDSHDVRLSFGGLHNIANALAAIGLALAVDISPQVAAEGLQHATLPRGRLQRVDNGGDVSVYVDYAHTREAFEGVLRFMESEARRKDGRLIAVFGAAGDRDKAKRPLFGKLAAEYCDRFVVTNEDPFGEDPEAIVSEIAAGAPRGERGPQWIVEMDRQRAIEIALEWARPRDIVVITGKGHETSIVEGETRIEWSDVDIARRALSRVAGGD